MEMIRSPLDRRAEGNKARLLQQTQSRVLEMIARGADLGDVLNEVMLFLEQQLEGVRTSVLLMDRGGGHLYHGAAPSLPDSYNAHLNGLPIGPRVGSCGTAAYYGEEVVVTDIATDERWVGSSELPLAHGLRACWSTPLLSPEGEVVGTFAVYYLEPRGPTEEERAFVRVAAHLAEVAVTNRRRLEDLHERERSIGRMAGFRSGIITMMEQGLVTPYGPDLYQHMLDQAVSSIPGAQAGALLLRSDDGRYAFAAANGHDFADLRRIRFSPAGAGFGVPVESPHPQVVVDPVMDPELTPEERALLIRDGRAAEIRSVLVVPILVQDGAATAFLTLDNFTSTDEFTGESVEAARVYAGYAAQLIRRASLEQRLERLAFTDSLTGLLNRERFRELLAEAVATAEKHGTEVAALFLDLDNLKLVNDSLGHLAGDQVLVEVAERLTSCLEPDQTLARLGGDEFMMLVVGSDVRARASELARRASVSLGELFRVGDHLVNVTASIGISLYPHDSDGPENLLRRSDIAMYHVKQGGKAHYGYFEPGMETASAKRMQLEEALRRALAGDEILLYYQPRIDVRTGRIVCLEALVRWRDGERGLVPPGEFIPLAERTNLIHPLGRRILELATRQLRAWRDAGLSDLRVAVNLSASQVARAELVEEVAAALAAAGLPATALEIEVVERAAMTDVVGSARKLSELKAMGVRVALDDFGVEYSSLAYLRSFPIDALKVDGVFVRGLGDETALAKASRKGAHPGADGAIVRAIVTLGNSMGLRVVAEGIETLAQWRAVRALGCGEAQGFLICRPAPPEALGSMLARGRVDGWDELAASGDPPPDGQP